MKIFYPYIRKFFLKHCRVINNIFSLYSLTVLNHWTYYIALSAGSNLLVYKCIRLRSVAFIHNAILYRKSVRRHLINY